MQFVYLIILTLNPGVPSFPRAPENPLGVENKSTVMAAKKSVLFFAFLVVTCSFQCNKTTIFQQILKTGIQNPTNASICQRRK